MTEHRRGYDMTEVVTEVAKRVHAKNLTLLAHQAGSAHEEEQRKDPFSPYQEWDNLHPLVQNGMREAVLGIIWDTFDVLDETDAEHPPQATVRISQEGGEVGDLQDLIDGKEPDGLHWVGDLNGNDLNIRVLVSDDPNDDYDE